MPSVPRESRPSSDILTELDVDARQTVVVFGGLTREGETPVFEFSRFFSEFDVRKVFVRDEHQAWYHLGASGLGDSIADVERGLFDRLGPDGCRHAVFTGGSMGGYAAMLFGARLGAGEVQAFAPQSYLGRVRRRLHKDFRWQRSINNMRADLGDRERHLDLRPALRRVARRRPVPIHIHVPDHGPDLVHARRLRRIPGVHIHRCAEVTDHRVARVLHEDGRLKGLFEDALGRVG